MQTKEESLTGGGWGKRHRPGGQHGPSQDSRNDIARIWAERFGLIGTSGSDFHKIVEGAFAGGILTDEPITSNEQLLEILRSGNFEMIKDNDKPQ